MQKFGNALAASAEKQFSLTAIRGAALPQKVFIQRDVEGYEYSADQPALLESTLNSILYGAYSRQNFIELFYGIPELFAPVNEIASRIAAANWQLVRTYNDEVDWNDEQFNRLFSQPNPLLTMQNMVYQAVCYEILTGKNLFYFNMPSMLAFDDYKGIATWSNLPSNVRAVPKKADPYTATEISDFVVNYEMPNSDGGMRYFDVEKVLPICHLNLKHPTDINQCAPLALGAEKALKNLIPVYAARNQIYIKRGALGFLVSRKTDGNGLVSLTKQEKLEANAEYQNNYGVTGGKNTTGVVSAPLDFVKTSGSIQELQPFDETEADAVAIYATLRVPRHLVPTKNESTYANAAADMKSFYTNTVIPWAKRLADGWTSYMKLKNYRRYILPNFDHVDELQENRKDKAIYEKQNGDTYFLRWSTGVWSLNQWIVAIGDEKVNNPLYDKKIFEMSSDEIDIIKNIINLKTNAAAAPPEAGVEDKGTKAKGKSN